MKRSKNRPLLLVFLLLSATALHAETATVVADNAPFYEKPDAVKTLALLPIAAPVSIDQASGGFYRVFWKGRNGWVRKWDLAVFDKRFSTAPASGSVVFSPRIVQDNGEWTLVYGMNGRLVKYSIDVRAVRSAQKTGPVTDIYPSPRNDLFLLEGLTTNGGEVHNLMLFHYNSGRQVVIGSFPESEIKIISTSFSRNADYLSILFRAGDLSSAAVYQTDTGEMIAFAREVGHVNWIGSGILLNNNANFWLFDASRLTNSDISYSKDRAVCRVSPDWVTGGTVDSLVFNDRLYIETSGNTVVLDISTGKTEKTPFHGLTFSADLSLDYYVRGESAVLRNIKENRVYPDFCGTDPKVDFLFFCGNNMVVKKKYEKVEALFLYSPAGDELYRYKAVDNAMAVAPNGIIDEFTIEKNLVMLAVENPEKTQYHIMLEKLQ